MPITPQDYSKESNPGNGWRLITAIFIATLTTLTIDAEAQLSAPECDAAKISCPLRHDEQSCSARNCIGVVINGNCKGSWKDINKPDCEVAKAANNKLYEADKARCEVQKAATVKACQFSVVVSNGVSGVAGLMDHASAEATEIGMRALPGEVREGIVHLTKEAVQEIDKYPIVAMYLSTTMKLQYPGFAQAVDDVTKRQCSANNVLAHLSNHEPRKVNDLGKNTGLLTTPMKQLGVSGWNPTGCSGQGEGVLVADAEHSSDLFWTVDVQLVSFSIDGQSAPTKKYIRVELEKGVPANDYASKYPLKKGDHVLFRGPIVFDNDPPRFLEVHPVDSFIRMADVARQPASAAAPTHVAAPEKEGWIFLGLMSPESAWVAGCPKNVKSAPLPIKKGDRLTVSNDVWMRGDSKPFQHAAAPAVGMLHSGDMVSVEQTALSHVKVGGNFVWAKVTTASAPSP